MNIVFNIRTIIAYTIIMVGVVIPQLLLHFGLDNPTLTELTSMWAIFLIILVAEIILLWQYIRNIKTAIFAVLIAVIVAVVLTMFFGA